MSRHLVTFRRPGAGGMVTDIPEWELSGSQSPYMENQIMPRGVSAEAGGYSRFGPATYGVALTGVGVYQFKGVATPLMLVSGASGYLAAVSFATPTTVTVLHPFTTVQPAVTAGWVPRAFYQGEVLWVAVNDGTASVVRYGGSVLASNTPTGTNVTYADDSTVITGTGTSFTTQYQVGDYLNARDRVWNDRIVAITSNTQMSVESPFGDAAGTFSTMPARSAVGLVGLCTRVTDEGRATVTPTTATGLGTDWLVTTQSQGVPRAGDYIGPNRAATIPPVPINTPSSNSALTIPSAPSGPETFTNEAYLIMRPLVAYDVCVHRNRVIAGGTAWDPNLLQVLPAGADLGRIYNEEASPDTDKVRSRVAAYRYVPAPTTPGRIVALLSSPGPALILRTNNAYGMYGEYPDDEIALLPGGDGAGCIDLRSACVGEPGAAWAGPEGIYLFRGGRVTDLTDGRRNREWRRLMNTISRATAVVTAGFYGNQLRVDVCDGTARTVPVKDYLPPVATSQTWIYDFAADAWCGIGLGVRGRHLHTAQLPGYPDELYAVTDDNVNQIATFGSTLRDEADATTTGRQPMVVDLAANSDGGTLSGLARVSQVKVTVEAPTSAGVTISNATGGTLIPATPQTVTPTAGELVTTRFRPETDVTTTPPVGGLGSRGRTARIRVTRTPTPTPNAFRVHEVEVIAKDRHVRA